MPAIKAKRVGFMGDTEVLAPEETPKELQFLRAVREGAVGKVAELMEKLKEVPEVEKAADMLLKLIKGRTEEASANDLKAASEIDLKDTSGEYNADDMGSILMGAHTRFPHTIYDVTYRFLMNIKPEEENPQLVDALFNILERDSLEKRFPSNRGFDVVEITLPRMCSPTVTKRLFETYIMHREDKIGEYSFWALQKIYRNVAQANAMGYDAGEYEKMLSDAAEQLGYRPRACGELPAGNRMNEGKTIASLVRIASEEHLLPEHIEEASDVIINGTSRPGTLSGDAVYAQGLDKSGKPIGRHVHFHLEHGTIDKWEKEKPGSSGERLKEMTLGLMRHARAHATGEHNPIRRYAPLKREKMRA